MKRRFLSTTLLASAIGGRERLPNSARAPFRALKVRLRSLRYRVHDLRSAGSGIANETGRNHAPVSAGIPRR